jgi:hypothetical protein
VAAHLWVFALPFEPWPPDRDPDRRRLELGFASFFAPVPDGPGRFALFFAPLDPRPDGVGRPRGASVFDPVPPPPR